MTHLAIVGTGYVGLTVGACLAHLGHEVCCVDSDADKIRSLRAGQVPFLEQEMPELLEEGLASGRLTFSADPGAVARAEVIFLCLPTPQSPEGNLNTAVLESAVRKLGPSLAPGAVLVTKSTVPVGTHRRVLEWVGRTDVHAVSNPEFLREGTAVRDFLEGDRIVIGAASEDAADAVAALYQGLRGTVLRTDPASAELLKFAANAFLATKVSFANEISRLCDGLGASIDAVIRGIGADPRIGRSFLEPGPGWGGSCFPKDTSALAYLAREHNVDLPVVAGAIEGNELQFEHVVQKVLASLAETPSPHVAVWGLTYKAGTDDLRDSPAVRIVSRLIERGVRVTTYDPAAPRGVPGAATSSDPYSACAGADALVVLTEWPAFRSLDMRVVARRMHGRDVVDARNLLDAQAVSAVGLHYVALGRSMVSAPLLAVSA